MLILGFRYGSETKEGISYTQKEYKYAKSKNIPIITLIKDENIASRPSERESDPTKENKLRLFRKEVSNKIAMFWKDKNELTTHLATSLSSEIRKRPGIGWIRTSANMEVIDNTINEWGLDHIFRLRADKNTEADGMLKKQVTLLDGIAFGLKTFRSAHTSDIEQCLRNGTAIRLLVMNPKGNFIKQREYEEDEVNGQISNSIEKLVEWAKKLKMTTGGNISVKYYNSMTLDFYWRIDKSLYVGPYLYGRASQATITYKFEEGGTGFQEYTQYFEDLWNDNEQHPDIKKKYEAEYVKTFKRMLIYKEDYLRFMKNFIVPYTNNNAEKQCRAVKARKNISGQFVSESSGEAYAGILSLLQTATIKNENALETLTSVFH